MRRLGDDVQPDETVGDMKRPQHSEEFVLIEGVRYVPASAVCRLLGLARQTLWRWRSKAQVPKGARYRGQQVLFTEGEVAMIREYANRLEPLEQGRSRTAAPIQTRSQR